MIGPEDVFPVLQKIRGEAVARHATNELAVAALVGLELPVLREVMGGMGANVLSSAQHAAQSLEEGATFEELLEFAALYGMQAGLELGEAVRRLR